MRPEHYIAIWIAGTIIAAILVGVATHDSRNESDRSFAVFAPLWPIFALIAIFVLTFMGLSSLGAWIGRKLLPST